MIDIPPKKYAGFWMRLAALLVDHSILGFALGCLIIFITIILIVLTPLTYDAALDFFEAFDSYNESEEDLNDLEGTWVEFANNIRYPVYILISIVYHAFCESSKLKGSVGKFILQIQVMKSNYEDIAFVRSFCRNALAWILGIMTLGLSHILAGLTKKKRALHDILAGCIVVNK